MTPLHEIALTNEAAWLDGVWIRTRSGPTAKSQSGVATVTVWHKVGALGGRWNRIRTVCGFGPREGFLWPSGGARLEVARPGRYSALPGAVCRRCQNDVPEADGEALVPDEVDIDYLAVKVAEHLAKVKETLT